jgi:hypothetical protein
MKYSRVLALIKQNQKPGSWNQLIMDDGMALSFCVNDVQLRLESRVAWKESQPYLRFTLYYSTTPIVWFLLPLGAQSEEQRLTAALSSCLGELNQTWKLMAAPAATTKRTSGMPAQSTPRPQR